MTEQDYLLIETYLQGELTETEITAFEQRLAAEPALATALAERRELNAFLRATSREDDLRATLQSLGDQHFNADEAIKDPDQPATVKQLPPLGGRGGRKRRTFYALAIAAAILLLAVLALPFLYGDGASYDDFNDHQPLALVVRGDADQLAEQAQTAYNAGQYPAAVDLLRRYLQSPEANQQARLALGISLLEIDRDEEAIGVFTELVNAGGSLSDYATYYLALAALKSGDEARAETILSALTTTDDFLAAKIARLRESL